MKGENMKKTVSSITAVILAGAMSASLAACANSAAETTTKAASVSESTASENAGSETKTAESSVSSGNTSSSLEKVGDFPSETITIQVPFSAGGATDIGARHLATALTKVTGQNVVIENPTGSGGWVSWSDLLGNADKYSDGYTLGLVNHNFVFGEYDEGNQREYGLDDLQLIANQCIDANALVIRKNEDRFSDASSFVEYAKSNPILISAQATGITDGDASTAEWFNKNFDAKITVVPVDGSADGKSMFLAGDTDVYFCNVSDILSGDSDEMTPIAVFTEKRVEQLPDVPTIKEATGKEYLGFSDRGYFYPKTVDPKKAEYMAKAIQLASEDPEYIKNMSELGITLDTSTGDDFRKTLESQLDIRLDVWNLQKK